MTQTLVHRVTLTKHQINGLEAHERRLIILLGHMSDELQTLTRLLLFSLHAPQTNPIAESIAGGRANVVLRLLCGKLWEAHQLITSRILQDKDARGIPDRLSDDAKACFQRIRSQAGGGTGKVLAKIRNERVFHFPSNEVIDRAYDLISDSEPLDLFLSDNADATYHHGAETVVQVAMFGVLPGDTTQDKVAALADIVIKASTDLITFAGYVVLDILDRARLLPLDMTPMIVPAAVLQDVGIPPVTVQTRS